MRFGQTLIKGRLLRRYKRFLADVELEDGEVITAHTANPGRMIGLTEPGSTVYLSHHDKPSRKLKYSWELIRVGRNLVGINPMLANDLVAEAIAAGRVPELAGYAGQRREVKYGARGSRIDLLLSDPERPDCYVENKNVTLVDGEAALFPDAVTERGKKHLLELRDVVAAGGRGVILFVVQRPEPEYVGPADAIDPAYGEVLREVAAAGVELLAYRAKVGRREIRITDSLPVRL